LTNPLATPAKNPLALEGEAAAEASALEEDEVEEGIWFFEVEALLLLDVAIDI